MSHKVNKSILLLVKPNSTRSVPTAPAPKVEVISDNNVDAADRNERVDTFQSQTAVMLREYRKKLHYVFTNPSSDYRRIGIHNKNPGFTLDVSGNVNTTLDYYYNSNFFLPPGTIIQYAISSVIPGGWLACDGAAVSRTTYNRLFGVIAGTYGSGNGTTTFNVPDFRGRVGVGSGTGSGLTARTIAATGGAETHTLTIAEMPAHTHTINDYVFGTQSIDGGGGTAADETTQQKTSNSTGGGGAHNNMQPFIVVQYLIRC